MVWFSIVVSHNSAAWFECLGCDWFLPFYWLVTASFNIFVKISIIILLFLFMSYCCSAVLHVSKMEIISIAWWCYVLLAWLFVLNKWRILILYYWTHVLPFPVALHGLSSVVRMLMFLLLLPSLCFVVFCLYLHFIGFRTSY